MTAPLISVALCTYNGASFLPQQLESLRQQDYPEVEIVAVDDGSTDGTLDLLQAFSAEHPRCKVVVNATRRGPTQNFARAFELCQGDLIAPCDQDDIWKPNKLSRLVAARGGAALVYCDSMLVNERGDSLDYRMSDKFNMYRGTDPRVFCFHNCVSGHAMLFTRGLLQSALPFPKNHFYDWWLAFVASATDRIEYLDECLVDFRQHDRNVSSFLGSQESSSQLRPSRLEFIRERTEWLRLLKDFPATKDRAFFANLYSVWLEWQHQYVCPAIVRFMLQHRTTIYALTKKKDVLSAWAARKLFWGVPTRRIVQPVRYRRISEA